MTAELEKFTVWRHSVGDRLTALDERDSWHRAWTVRQQGAFSAIRADLGEMSVQLPRRDSMLEALCRNQSWRSAALREPRAGQGELRRDVTEVSFGARTTIDLVTRAETEES